MKLNKKMIKEESQFTSAERMISPVCWMLWGALTLARGGTPLYWGRSIGAWGRVLLWRWGSDVLSRGRNL